MRRTDQRRAAVWALYQSDPPRPAAGRDAAGRRARVHVCARRATSARAPARGSADELIAHATRPDGRLDRIAPLERSILRVALLELLYPGIIAGEDPIPPEGAIDEAVETAKRFCGAEAPRFVNGILGSGPARPDRQALLGRRDRGGKRPQPPVDRVGDAGVVSLEAMVALDGHHDAVERRRGRSGMPGKRSLVPCTHEHRDAGPVELGFAARESARSRSGPARRLQREGQAQHPDRTGPRRRPAGDPGARRAPSGDEPQAAERAAGTGERLRRLQPRGVEPGRSGHRRAPPRDAVGLLDEGDRPAGLQRG